MTTGAPLLLHRAPAAGFDEPFEMLAACHERVERMLALLEKLQPHVAAHGPDRQARDAARDVIRYFDLAAPHHHEDEERHVFPRLRAAGHGALADRLLAEHRRMAEAWQDVRRTLTPLAEGRLPAMAADLWPGFVALHRRHLREEDATAYPAVQPALGAADLQAMGDEMAARRGLRG